VKSLWHTIKFPIVFVLIIWAVHAIQWLSPFSFAALGIIPRTYEGLMGIFTAPLIHGSWEHLFSNSVPLLILGGMTFLVYKRVATKAFFVIYILTGFLVWLFARGGTSHIGASGVVYGLVAFLFWNGVFRRNLQAVLISLCIMFLYSGMFYGVLPNQPGVSWESHLLGAFTGILASWMFRKQLQPEEERKPLELKDDPEKHFLPKDTFDVPLSARKQNENDTGYDNLFNN